MSPPSISSLCGVFQKSDRGGVSISFRAGCLVLFLLLLMSMVPIMHPNTQEVGPSFGDGVTYQLGTSHLSCMQDHYSMC